MGINISDEASSQNLGEEGPSKFHLRL